SITHTHSNRERERASCKGAKLGAILGIPCYHHLDVIVGGSDTTTTTMEWVMTELMQNPEEM
ncbi:unnamed protein product, partial [Prunus brigantina]